jgi:hypothetical protein
MNATNSGGYVHAVMSKIEFDTVLSALVCAADIWADCIKNLETFDQLEEDDAKLLEWARTRSYAAEKMLANLKASEQT